jgi:glycosyltransferase involved in cell wall biosynthesis
MDLMSEMLVRHLSDSDRPVDATELRPGMTRRITRLPLLGRTTTAGTADRLLNRVWDYPRWLGPRIAEFDLFHIVDHSYAHLATQLPPGRSLVTCHDADAFRGLFPGSDRGALVQRALGRRLLAGMRAARKVMCVSAATRNELIEAAAVPAGRVVVIPNGVHPAYRCGSDAAADREAASLLGPVDDRVELLQVGSTIPRKRVDVLLKVVSGLRKTAPRTRLIHAGGAFTTSHWRLVRQLGLDGHVTDVPFVRPDVLAAIYRRAALLLQTSDREGFGLPVAEALCCGTPVVASDLPALREVGGPPTTFCPVGDVQQWIAATSALLAERASDPAAWRARQAAGVRWAQRFDWHAHASATAAIYRDVLSSPPDRESEERGER